MVLRLDRVRQAELSAGNQYGQFWHQNETIRPTIQADLDMIASDKLTGRSLSPTARRSGKQIDNEIDVAMQDQQIVQSETRLADDDCQGFQETRMKCCAAENYKRKGEIYDKR